MSLENVREGSRKPTVIVWGSEEDVVFDISDSEKLNTKLIDWARCREAINVID